MAPRFIKCLDCGEAINAKKALFGRCRDAAKCHNQKARRAAWLKREAKREDDLRHAEKFEEPHP